MAAPMSGQLTICRPIVPAMPQRLPNSALFPLANSFFPGVLSDISLLPFILFLNVYLEHSLKMGSIHASFFDFLFPLEQLVEKGIHASLHFLVNVALGSGLGRAPCASCDILGGACYHIAAAIA